MSLIQAALNKTQNKISSSTEPQPTQTKVANPRSGALKGLGVWDHEVEQKLSKIKPGAPRAPRTSKVPVLLFILLGLLFIAGVLYWSDHRMDTEAVPPLVVKIEGGSFSEAPGVLSEPIAKVIASKPVDLSPVDARGHFFLSGIAWGGAQPYAVINGQILRSGEIVDKKAVLQSIAQDHVLLDYQGEIIRLTLKR